MDTIVAALGALRMKDQIGQSLEEGLKYSRWLENTSAGLIYPCSSTTTKNNNKRHPRDRSLGLTVFKHNQRMRDRKTAAIEYAISVLKYLHLLMREVGLEDPHWRANTTTIYFPQWKSPGTRDISDCTCCNPPRLFSPWPNPE